MDFTEGKEALLQALALMTVDGELSMKIEKLMESVREDKAKTVTLLCEALALQKEQLDRKKKCVEQLQEAISWSITQNCKWWQLLVQDRKNLLLTISDLELEKDRILHTLSGPEAIYGPVYKMFEKKGAFSKDDMTSTCNTTITDAMLDDCV